MNGARIQATIVTVIVLMSTGCAAPLASFEQMLEESGVARFSGTEARRSSVEVRATLDTGCAGRGAVVGPCWVLTVEHVLGGRDRAFVATTPDGGWVGARVIRRMAGEPEAMVLLELEADEGAYGALLGFSAFEADAVVEPSSTGVPARVVTARGSMAWAPGVLVPGDSGSPVVDEQGRLVGLVSGRRDDMGVYVALAPRAGIPELLLAARR